MPKISPFEKYAEPYDKWFDENRWVYEAELRAVRAMIPSGKRGIEIGAGTGRFTEPLGIRYGVEPAERMREIAERRRIRTLGGVAEALPLADAQFDFVLMVTTVCFFDDINKALLEAYRVLRPGGFLIIGFIDRSSRVGQTYVDGQKENRFYKEARFFSVDEIAPCMGQAGFRDFLFKQTIFKRLAEITRDEPVKDGYGEGSFVVIRGTKAQIDMTGSPR
jgi:SAM-dependent methyltransferase